MIVKTRSEMRALLTRRCRIVDHLNSHPAADLNIDLDESYRCMRDFVSNRKWGTYLLTTGSTALPTTAAVAGENYAAIPVPATCRIVKKLEVKMSNSWIPAEEVPFGQLRMYNTDNGAGTRGPFAWTMLDSGIQATVTANSGTATAGVIALMPIPTAGSYQLWYLAEHAALSADSGAGGFFAYGNQAMEDYHLFHCAAKILISDNDSQGMLDGILKLLAKAEQTLESGAPTASGAKTWRRARNY